MIGVLFLMGTQSTFFGPLKYGILPDHLAGYFYTKSAYASDTDSAQMEVVNQVGPIINQYPAYALKVDHESFSEEYLVKADTFDWVLPRREREKLGL